MPDGFAGQDHPGLVSYAALLGQWNKKINLVGREDMAQLWPRHIEDALFLYRCLPTVERASWLLDVGTGGGLPGMVLGIVDSSRNYVLLDRSERKIRFLNQVVAELKLTNVFPVCGDFLKPLSAEFPDVFNVICARAVAPPDKLWSQVNHLLSHNGELLVACGPQTRQQLPTGVDVEWWPDTKGDGQRGVIQLRSDKA